MRHTASPGANARYRARPAWRKKGRIAVAGAAVVAALAGTSMAGVPAASASQSETVIVTSTGLLSPVLAVLEVGGTILTQYDLIDGVDASIPTVEESLLAALPGITVTPDISVSVQSTTESTGPHTPSDAFLQETGSTTLASHGDTGQGVTVAVLDTGIDNLPDFSGRLIGGVDLTNGNNPYQDSYGHGTFVAGLIAGDGTSSGGQYSGEAPGAKLVSIKVAGADGTLIDTSLAPGVPPPSTARLTRSHGRRSGLLRKCRAWACPDMGCSRSSGPPHDQPLSGRLSIPVSSTATVTPPYGRATPRSWTSSARTHQRSIGSGRFRRGLDAHRGVSGVTVMPGNAATPRQLGIEASAPSMMSYCVKMAPPTSSTARAQAQSPVR